MNTNVIFIDPNSQKKRLTKVESFDELKNQILALKKEFKNQDYPIGIDLNRDNNSLSIGMGKNDWVLVRTLGDNFNQHCSLGNEKLQGSTPYYLGEYTDIPLKWLISEKDAWKAIEFWFNTGELSRQIQWTIENY